MTVTHVDTRGHDCQHTNHFCRPDFVIALSGINNESLFSLHCGTIPYGIWRVLLWFADRSVARGEFVRPEVLVVNLLCDLL